MPAKYQEFGQALSAFLSQLIGRGVSSWFDKEVGLDDRNLRRWTAGENLPSEESWQLFCQAVQRRNPTGQVTLAIDLLSRTFRELRKARTSALLDQNRGDGSENKTIEIEDDIYRGLFDTLQMLAASVRPASLPSPWISRFPLKAQYLERILDLALHEIRIICYSFIIWKDRHEQAFLKFLSNGGRLRVLMIHPESRGFLEKTAMEAYGKSQSKQGIDIASWQHAIPPLRRMHRKDIEASIAALEHWQERTEPASVQCRLYYDTPPFNGAVVDKAIFITSHFMSPTTRAFDTPTLCVDDYGKSPTFKMLYWLFHSWFEIKFSTGFNPL